MMESQENRDYQETLDHRVEWASKDHQANKDPRVLLDFKATPASLVRGARRATWVQLVHQGQ